jgi:hypothetical protein
MRYPNLARIPRGGELTELIDVPELLSWELRKNPPIRSKTALLDLLELVSKNA